MGDKAAESATATSAPSNINQNTWNNNYHPANNYITANGVDYAQYYAYCAQQYAQYQHQLQSQSNTTSQASQNNAPPGFSNATISANNQNDSDLKNNSNIDDSSSSVPPLPSGPPPPPKQAPSQFGPIKFHLNKQGNLTQMSPLNQMNNYQIQNNNNSNINSGGGGKKKRKKNKNKQNNNNNFNMNFQNSSSQPNNNYNSPPLPVYPPPVDFSRPPPPLMSPNLQNNSNFNNNQNQSNSSNVEKPNNNSKMNDSNGNTNNSNSEAAWPESLNTFVTKCYAKCKTDFDKDQIEICLKGKITSAATKGELWTKDWDNEPIPSVHSDGLSPPKSFLNAKKTVVTGQLAQYQNSQQQNNKKSGLSNSLGARLGIKSGINKRLSPSKSPRHSRSNSRDPSPPHKRRSSEDDGYYGLNSSINHINNANKKNKKKNKKQKAAIKSGFYSEHGAIGGQVEGDAERLKKRLDRFNKSSAPSTPINPTPNKKKRLSIQTPMSRFFVDDTLGTENLDLLDLHIVGTCRDLEKSFLRLTKAPLPSEVRPVEVLTYSLHNVKNKWVEKQDYFYACDQLKSIRQDLTVC